MRYINVTDDTRIVPALRFIVEPGGLTPELTADEAKGFEQQTDVWQPEKKQPRGTKTNLAKNDGVTKENQS